MKNGIDKQVVFSKEQIEISATKSNYNNIGIVSNFESNRTYILHFDSVNFLQGISDGVTVSLYDPVAKKGYKSIVFDVDYCNKSNGYEWIFKTPVNCPDSVQLLLYSGEHGKTADIQTVYKNIEVSIY